MGKSRRSRTKRHLSAVKPENPDEKTQSYCPLPEEILSKAPVISIESKDGTNDQERGARVISKKEKQKRRHDNWLRKLDAARVQKEQTKKHTPVIVGDLEPLKLALSELVDVTHKGKDKDHTRVRQLSSRGGKTTTRKGRQHVLQSEVERFGKVLQHKAFREDPIGTISQHIRNVANQEQISKYTSSSK